MTPQSNFMILAPINRRREDELRRTLDAMNESPGCVNPRNRLIPFGEFGALHFARFVILDDQTTGDIGVYGLRAKTYPLYLAFIGDIDGDVSTFLDESARRAEEGLRALFSCCEGFEAQTDLRRWMQEHHTTPVAAYVNWQGRTVQQIHQEAALRAGLENYLLNRADTLKGMSPNALHATLRRFVEEEKTAGRLTLTAEPPTPLGWRVENLLHLLGWPFLILIALPLLLLAAPFYVLALRSREKTDPEICPTVDQTYSEALSRLEDHDVTNQFSAMGTLKPGLLRLITTFAVLTTVNYAARHIVRNGRLGRIRTIHFARWVFVGGTERMVFFSNYDGSVESYMDDFINKTGFGLNASFSNGIGYPRTNWLLLDGCADERKYKEFLRRHTLPAQVWYKAYPGLTAIELERNTRLRRGVETASMNEEEAREWVALL